MNGGPCVTEGCEKGNSERRDEREGMSSLSSSIIPSHLLQYELVLTSQGMRNEVTKGKGMNGKG